MRRPLPNALGLDLAGGLRDQVTPHAGAALLIEVLRRSGVIAAAERQLPAKRSTKGLRQGELVEVFIVLRALSGECLDDFDTLRRDRGLAALPGYDLPAASTARQRLDRFHDPEAVAGRPRQGSFIPAESAGQRGKAGVLSAAKDRAHQPCPEERAGRGRLPVRQIRGHRRLAPPPGPDPEPARDPQGRPPPSIRSTDAPVRNVFASPSSPGSVASSATPAPTSSG